MSAPRSISRFVAAAPIAAAQAGAAAYALADFLWVARPSEIGALPVARGVLLAVALGAAVGFVIGAAAHLMLAGAPALRRPGPGAVLATPVAALAWMACFAGAVLFAAFRLRDPALAAWAVALLGVAAIPAALLAAMAIARLAGPLSRWPGLGAWLAIAVAAAGAVTAVWVDASLRPLGLGLGALAIALAVARARPVRPAVTGAAAVIGAAIALSPLANDPVAWEAGRGGSFVPAIERALAPLIDIDSDGRLPVFGSGDCDEGEAAVSPGAIEIAGNGVDEDCRFGDLPRRPAPPAPAGPKARAVLLLSLTGADLDDTGALSPRLPRTEAAMARGVRFTGGRGIAGRFVDVAPLLIDGALPLELGGAHGGFAVDGRSIPAAVERAGGRAALSIDRRVRGALNTAFHPRRTRRDGKTPRQTARRFARALSGRPGFLWVHLDARRDRDAVDAAAAALIAGAAAAERTAVVVVGLPPRARTPGDPGGGPLAVIAADLDADIDERPTGLHDVYPTLADLFGLAIDRPIAGHSLLAPAAGAPAFAGVIEGGVAELGAFDASSWVRHLPRARRFASPAGTFAEDGAGPDHLAEATRRRLLGPRLAALNRRRATAQVAALPGDLVGTPSTIARALALHGCAIEHRPGGVRIDVYFGGFGLEAADLLAFKLFAPGASSVRGRAHPATPLSELERGAVYRQTFDIDTRSLGSGTSFLWIGLLRGGALLPVTSGAGNTPKWALACRVEPAVTGGSR